MAEVESLAERRWDKVANGVGSISVEDFFEAATSKIKNYGINRVRYINVTFHVDPDDNCEHEMKCGCGLQSMERNKLNYLEREGIHNMLLEFFEEE